MALRHAIRGLLAALLAVLSIAVPIGCARNPVDFHVVTPPVRFVDLRETAAWCPGFRDEWWPTIDAEYTRFDAAVADFAQLEWESFALSATIEQSQGYQWGKSHARLQWNRNFRVSDVLAAEESALCDRLSAALPPEAAPFIGLLRARSAFWRRSAPWAGPSEVPPGPLEVLAPLGRERSAEAVAAATDAYARLALVAEQATRRRADLYVGVIADIEPLELAARASADELAAARASDSAAGAEAEALAPAPQQALEAADASARQAQENRWNRYFDRDRASVDETYRVALLESGLDFAESIADPARRESFRDACCVALHGGVPEPERLRDLAARFEAQLARSRPDDDSALAALHAVRDHTLAGYANARSELASRSAATRERAYAALSTIEKRMEAELVAAFGEGNAPAAGGETAVPLTAPSPSAPAAPSETLTAALDVGRSREMQSILGRPLAVEAVVTLAERLPLDADRRARLYARAGELLEELGETVRVAEREFQSLGEGLEDLPPAELDAAVRRLGREGRAILARTRTKDAAANEAFLSFATELAAVRGDDPRLEIARLELELALAPDFDRTEDLVGSPAEAGLNPFAVVRALRLDRDTESTAEAIVFARRDELRAAADELYDQMLVAAERFLRRSLDRDQLRPRRGDYAIPQRIGLAAAELRFAIADDLRVALGDEIAGRYLAALRAKAAPGLDPPESAAFLALDAFAARAKGTPELALAIADTLDDADAARESALRAAHRWKLARIPRKVEGDAAWRALWTSSPVGAQLRSRALDANDRAIARCAAILAAASPPPADTPNLDEYRTRTVKQLRPPEKK